MTGILINGIRYFKLMNDNEIKNKSLEDNVYFTLRDIFLNGEIDMIFSANEFNSILTNNICYDDRDETFKYSNVLQDGDSNYTRQLHKWLNKDVYGVGTEKYGYGVDYYKTYIFKFEELTECEKDCLDMTQYIKFDDWWEQLKNLIKQLEAQLVKLEELKSAK